MKKKLSDPRILLVVPYTKPDYSGSGINAFNFARFLQGVTKKVTLLTFNRNFQYRSRELLEGVSICRILYFNHNLLTKVLSVFLILPAYIVQVIRHDIISIYGAHVIGYQLLILCSRLFGRKLVFQSLLIGEDDMETLLRRQPGWLRKNLRVLFRNIDLYHAINPVFINKFRQLNSSKVIVCPQGYDSRSYYAISREEILKKRAEFGIPPGQLVLLSVGFLIARKGYEELFRALSDIDLDFQLYILGEYRFHRRHFLYFESEETNRVINYGKKALGSRLVLTGPVDNVRDYMHAADMYLLHSRNEGLPNALLEAMACGCTVLSRDLPGLEGYILEEEKTGMLYRDDKEFVRKLNTLAADDAKRLRLGQNASSYIRNFGSFEIVWQQMERALYG